MIKKIKFSINLGTTHFFTSPKTASVIVGRKFLFLLLVMMVIQKL